jgi:hypothetical protein
MSTQTKIDPTQRNAAASGNPRIAARSLFNRYLVLPTENIAEFEQMYNALEAEYRPVDAIERMHFDMIVSSKWRLRRLRKFEAALYAAHLENLKKRGPDFVYVKEDARLFVDRTGELSKHIARVERFFKRDCKDFLQHRAQTQRDLARQSQSRTQ